MHLVNHFKIDCCIFTLHLQVNLNHIVSAANAPAIDFNYVVTVDVGLSRPTLSFERTRGKSDTDSRSLSFETQGANRIRVARDTLNSECLSRIVSVDTSGDPETW